MELRKRIGRWIALVPLLMVAACSSGGGGSKLSVATVVQDLAANPDGLVTVVTFNKAPGALTMANFAANGGQNPTGVIIAGTAASVTWDARVTPMHQLQVTGVSGVAPTFRAVTSSDLTTPTVSFTSATQTVGLGGDTISLSFTGGPRVVQSVAEDITNWDLEVNGQSMDLTGSVFVLNPATQVLDITLGPNANLHASFDITPTTIQTVADVTLAATPLAGTVLDDVTAPGLVSALQNLDDLSGGSEYGNVVEFTFTEAMDPVFSIALSHFRADLPNVAINVEQINAGTTLRVTYSAPVIPSMHTIELSGLLDAHGNPFTDVPAQAITAGSLVANAYDGIPEAFAVENVGGDYIEVITTQAFHEPDAEDPSKWTFLVNAAPVSLVGHTLDYDFIAKTLTITLINYELPYGGNFTIQGAGVTEVDGETFTAGVSSLIDGDDEAPFVVGVVQNRNQDPGGMIVDVTLNEDLEETAAETLVNWTFTGGLNVIAAELLSGLKTVRLTLDAPVMPGMQTLTADNLVDLATNAMPAADPGNVITSTDTAVPQPSAATAEAFEGANNDTIEVTFDDDMYQPEVENPLLWSVESPISNVLDTDLASVSYDAMNRVATLTLGAGTGEYFKAGDDFQVSFTTMRDLGGNPIGTDVVSGNIQTEMNLPEVHTIWRDLDPLALDQVVIRFTEHCDLLDDLYANPSNLDGTRYVLKDSIGTFRGYAVAANSLDDGLGVRVTFPQIVSATDLVDVAGVTDLAGNYMFPAVDVPLVDEDDGLPPALSVGTSAVTPLSGEDNDTITVIFDRPMSPWNLFDPANYTVETGGNPVDLSQAEFAFDGNDTVTITLSDTGSDNLQETVAYDIIVNNLQSAQGVVRTVPDSDNGIVASGDPVSPDVPVGEVTVDSVPNSVVIEANEALDVDAATVDPTVYVYDGANLGVAATLLGPRAVRVTFAVQPVDTFMLDMPLVDLAGNPSGLISRAVSAPDVNGPIIASVAGVATPNLGGDIVTIQFNESIDKATGLNTANYSVTNGPASIDISSASMRYDSSTQTVSIHLPDGEELNINDIIVVNVQNVEDHSGNPMPFPVSPAGSVGGDALAPDFDRAYVNYREDLTGLTIDVLFTEDVDQAFVTNLTNWTASGGQIVQTVTMIAPDFARITLDAVLGVGDTLDMTGLPDLAQRVSGAISTEPVQ